MLHFGVFFVLYPGVSLNIHKTVKNVQSDLNCGIECYKMMNTSRNCQAWDYHKDQKKCELGQLQDPNLPGATPIKTIHVQKTKSGRLASFCKCWLLSCF